MFVIYAILQIIPFVTLFDQYTFKQNLYWFQQTFPTHLTTSSIIIIRRIMHQAWIFTPHRPHKTLPSFSLSFTQRLTEWSIVPAHRAILIRFQIYAHNLSNNYIETRTSAFLYLPLVIMKTWGPHTSSLWLVRLKVGDAGGCVRRWCGGEARCQSEIRGWRGGINWFILRPLRMECFNLVDYGFCWRVCVNLCDGWETWPWNRLLYWWN